MTGYFVQASRLIHDRFRPTVRVGKLDYLDPGNLLGRNASKGNKDVTEVILALAYYPVPSVVFKVEYAAFLEGSRLAEKDNDPIGLQAAVRF